MNRKHIGFGIFLLTIGILWILFNLGILGWTFFQALILLWPLILIVMGINVIFRHQPYVRLVTWLLFLTTIVSYSFFVETKSFDTKPGDGKNVVIENFAETKYGDLTFALGGLKMKVDSGTTNLLDAFVSDGLIDCKVDYRNGKETAVVNVERTRNFPVSFKGNGSSQLKLNDGIIWDIDVNAGAIDGKFDVSGLKVRKLDLDIGVSKIDLILGKNYELTKININGGVSSIDVTIPSSSGVRVNFDGGLNGTNLKRLGWEKHGSDYESPNYDSAQSKVEIDANLGVSEFKIHLQE